MAKHLWLIRNAALKIEGPFSSEQITEKIQRDTYSGDEYIQKQPNGEWIKLSQHPEFCDVLLDNIQNIDSRKHYDDEDESVSAQSRSKINPVNTGDAQNSQTPQYGKAVKPGSKKENTEVKNSADLKIPVPKPITKALDDVIELKNINEHVHQETIKRSKKPLFIVGGALLVVGIALLFKPKTAEGKLHLLVPRSKQVALSPQQVNEKLKKSLLFFQRDTFSSYIAAENQLVEVIEGSPQNTQAMQLLCLTYRELWPYVYQDSKDLAAVAKITKDAKVLNPSGVDGGVCEIVNLLVMDRAEDASHLTDSWLQLQPQLSVLYDFKGEILLINKDYLTALPYYEKTSSLWPQWQKSYIQQARSQTYLSQYTKAIENYKYVLQIIPEHLVAKVELGLLELHLFQHLDRAMDLIHSAISQKDDRMPQWVESNALVGLGDIEIQKGHKSQAIDYFKKAYKLNSSNRDAKARLDNYLGRGSTPENSDPNELLAQCSHYLKSGEYFSAQAECKAAYQKDPKRGTAALKAGQALWQLNQTGDAISWVQKAIQSDSQLVDAYVTLADYYGQRYDFESAAKVLQTAFQRMPKRYEIIRGFAMMSNRKRDFKSAETYAAQALKMYDSDSESFLIMAQAKMGLKKYTEAQDYVGRAIELDTTNAEAQSLYAKVLVGVSGPSIGIEYINKLILNFPKQTKYRMALAEIFIQNENYPEAEQMLKQLIALEPENKKAIISLGSVYKSQNRYNEALGQFFSAGSKDPSDANPIFMAGELYFQTGKYENAAKQFDQVLRQNPRYPLAHYQKGRSLLMIAQYAAALEEAKQEQTINPNIPEGYLLSAEANYALKNFTQCAGDFQKAIAKAQMPTEVYVKMSRCYRRSGALDAALSLLRQAASRESGFADLYRELGAIYQTKGVAEEALKAYENYLQLNPSANDRGQVEAQMRRIESGNVTLESEAF